MRNFARFILITSIILGAGFAAREAWFSAGRPVAYSIIQVKSQSILGQPDLVGQNWNHFRQTQSALVKSRLVLNAGLTSLSPETMRKLCGDQDPLKWLEEHLKVDFKLAPELMRISLDGGDADEMKAVITAVTDAYLKADIARQTRLAEQRRREELQSLKSELLMELNQVRFEIEKLKQDHRPLIEPLSSEPTREQVEAVLKGYLLYLPSLRTTDLPLGDLDVPEVRLNYLRSRETRLKDQIDRIERLLQEQLPIVAHIEPRISLWEEPAVMYRPR